MVICNYNFTIIESNHICIFFGHHLNYWTSIELLPNNTQDLFTTSTGILLEQHKNADVRFEIKIEKFC